MRLVLNDLKNLFSGFACEKLSHIFGQWLFETFMKVFNSKTYTDKLRQHFETYYSVRGKPLTLGKGPKEKLHRDFFVLELPPNKRHSMFCYCTVGMSADRLDDNKN